ncbi:MAG: alpha/beta hydrolase [Xanthomonadales bacterium]|nr:alpha/beta hydrolase [Xanthomonadales bacterium]
MPKAARFSVCLTLLLFIFMDTSESSEVSVTANVSYKSVTGLSFVPADKKLVYGDANPELQYGLLWLPKNLASSETAPLIVLIHGGCWLNAYDVQHSFPLSSALAEAGYAVWSLEYRRTGDAGGAWPGSFEDVRQGLAFTSHLKDYPVDLDQIIIMGHSAGGHLALLAASENQNVTAVIGLAAITDIVGYSKGKNSCQTASIDFMGGTYEQNLKAYKAANPASRPLHTKTTLLYGDIDSIVPLEQSQLPGASAVMFEGAGHFDWVHPGTGAHQVLLSTLENLLQK